LYSRGKNFAIPIDADSKEKKFPCEFITDSPIVLLAWKPYKEEKL